MVEKARVSSQRVENIGKLGVLVSNINAYWEARHCRSFARTLGEILKGLFNRSSFRNSVTGQMELRRVQWARPHVSGTLAHRHTDTQHSLQSFFSPPSQSYSHSLLAHWQVSAIVSRLFRYPEAPRATIISSSFFIFLSLHWTIFRFSFFSHRNDPRISIDWFIVTTPTTNIVRQRSLENCARQECFSVCRATKRQPLLLFFSPPSSSSSAICLILPWKGGSPVLVSTSEWNGYYVRDCQGSDRSDRHTHTHKHIHAIYASVFLTLGQSLPLSEHTKFHFYTFLVNSWTIYSIFFRLVTRSIA